MLRKNANCHIVNPSHNLNNSRLNEEISNKDISDDNTNSTETNKECTNTDWITNENDEEQKKNKIKKCKGFNKKNGTGFSKRDDNGSRTGWRIPACILEMVPEQIPRLVIKICLH